MPVNLTVHRNTVEKRRRREVAASLLREARDLRGDMDGFALVSWRNDGSSRCEWATGDLKLNTVPDFARTALIRSISKSDCAGLINHAMGFDDPDDSA